MQPTAAASEEKRAALASLISGEVFRFSGSAADARDRVGELKLLAEARLRAALELSGWCPALFVAGGLTCVVLLGTLQSQLQGGNNVPLSVWIPALAVMVGLTWFCAKRNSLHAQAFQAVWGDWPSAAPHRLQVAEAALAALADALEVNLLVNLGPSQAESALVGEPGPRDDFQQVSVYETTQLQLTSSLTPERPLELSVLLREELCVGKRADGSDLRKVKQKSTFEAKLGVPVSIPDAVPDAIASQISEALGDLPEGVKQKEPEVAAEWVRFRLSTWDCWTYPGPKAQAAAERVSVLLGRISSAFVAASAS